LPYPDSAKVNTNWIDEIFAPALMTSHNLSFSGGNDKTVFFASGSYFNQDGIVGEDKANYKRFTGKLNLDHKVNNWLKIGTRISYSHYNRKDVDENNEFGGVITNAISLDPLTPAYVTDTSDFSETTLEDLNGTFEDFTQAQSIQDENGYFGVSERVRNEIKNPLAQINNDHGNWNQDKLLAGFNADLSPFEGFTFKSKFDIDLSYAMNESWTPAYYYHSSSSRDYSDVSIESERWYSWQLENYFTYKRKLGESNIEFLGGTSAREYDRTKLMSYGDYMVEEGDDYALIDSTTLLTKQNPGNDEVEEDRLLSYYSRIMYNYKEKYMINLTYRMDGSSKFGPNNKWGHFPSVSAGWVISRENFWFGGPINFLKIRASWGQNGSLSNLINFGYVSTMTTAANNYISGTDELIGGAEPERITNNDYRWETSEQTDIGVDFGFFENRLTFSADYFIKKTKDLLLELPVPLHVGNDPPWGNAGDIENKGWEFDLGLKHASPNFNFDFSFNASHVENNVVYFGNQEGRVLGANLGTTGTITIFEIGYPAWFFYGHETDGIFQNWTDIYEHCVRDADGNPVTSAGAIDGELIFDDDGIPTNDRILIQRRAIPGDVRFVDHNQDSTITDADKTYIGDPHPDWIFGVTLNLEYKAFDFMVFAQGSMGNEVYNGIHRTDLVTNNKPLYFSEESWSGENSTI